MAKRCAPTCLGESWAMTGGSREGELPGFFCRTFSASTVALCRRAAPRIAPKAFQGPSAHRKFGQRHFGVLSVLRLCGKAWRSMPTVDPSAGNARRPPGSQGAAQVVGSASARWPATAAPRRDGAD